MSAEPRPRRVAIGPVDCFRRGWGLIQEDYALLVGISIVAILLIVLGPLGILAGPMVCGLMRCYMVLERGETLTFSTLWKGFDHFLPTLVALLLQVGIAFLILVPFYGLFLLAAYGASEADDGAAVVLTLVSILLLLVFTAVCVALEVALVFTYNLIAEHRVGGWRAIRISAAAAARNPWGLTGLVLLNGLVSLLASLACFLPLFLFVPLSYAAIFQAYRKVFPLQGDPVAEGA